MFILSLLCARASLIGIEEQEVPQMQKDFFKAIDKGDVNKVNQLIEKDKNLVNANGGSKDMPLCVALYKQREKVAELLVRKGADVNVMMINDNTPLHVAVIDGYKELVELIIEKGADINAKNKNDHTPLLIAVANEDSKIVELLISKGANVNAKEKNGSTPLHRAAFNRDLYLVKLLFEKNADVKIKNVFGITALHAALFNSSENNRKYTRDEGRLYKSKNKRRNGNLEVVKALINFGVVIDEKDIEGNTALHYAAKNVYKKEKNGYVGIAKFLIENGADVNAKNNEGRTPLFLAIDNGNTEIKNILIQKGAKINFFTRVGLEVDYRIGSFWYFWITHPINEINDFFYRISKNLA